MSAAKPKRIRRNPETTRALILDQAERIMLEEGYAAVTTRRIALELKINAATVHYYYPTTDDLFLALHKRMVDRQLAELQQVLQSDDPLRAYWAYQSTWSQAALGVEFLALCYHRKSLSERVSQAADAARESQSQALGNALARSLGGPAELTPTALATVLTAIGRLLVNEERVGISRGHAEVRTLVTWFLDALSQKQDTSPPLN
ncbi:MAG: TetR/AcrR family transcriptional regulator [Novosphingobium sp.]|nr:TetR/AcrR family transcriptional regulator [Novosphingobium sp.]